MKQDLSEAKLIKFIIKNKDTLDLFQLNRMKVHLGDRLTPPVEEQINIITNRINQS